MFRFALASLTPAALLALGCLLGGAWPLLGLLSITALVFLLDRLGREAAPAGASGLGLCLAIGAVHFGLLALGVRAIGTGAHLDAGDRILLLIGLGLWFGQVANPVAHELIHRPGRGARRLGAAIYASLLYGHHVSAHLRVHHIHAATDADPNSARAGEGFYAYAWRALRGEFAAGLRAENAARGGAGAGARRLHPYVGYALGSAASIAASYWLGGWGGAAALLALAAHAQSQLLLSDYVQHYGLRRRLRPDGRPEPVGPQHSWNAPHWYSAAMMLNAPRHSDHHLRPGRAFPALELAPGEMPMLPRSLPAMAALALVPPAWRRVMDPRAARWQGDLGNVTPPARPAAGPAPATLTL